MNNRKSWKDMLAGSLLTVLALSLVTPAIASTGTRTVEIAYNNIKLVVNGETVTPKDGSGKTVEPFTLNGTTYLPVRALGNALDMDVDWDGRTSTVYLESRSPDAPLKDEDYIGLAKAREIALEHADVRAAKATFFREKLDWEDGRAVYEIEFYSGDTEYDYDIDAVTGKVLDWDHDVEGYKVPSTAAGSTSDRSEYITLARAKALAQARAPGATLVECELDWDDGRAIYEGELRDGRTEYEFELDAVTGAFLQWEVDYDD